MTDQIPPMPELKDGAPLWPYINALEAHARDLAARLAESQALAGDLAEALEQSSARFAELVPCTTSGYKPNRIAKQGLEHSSAALTRYQEATR